MRRGILRLLAVFAICLLPALGIGLAGEMDAPSGPKPSVQECMGCHDGTIEGAGPDDIAGMVDPVPAGWQPTQPLADAKRAGVTMTVDLAKMGKSVHGTDCLMCHADITKLNHAAKLNGVDCGTCHDDVALEYRRSGHYRAVTAANHAAPLCADCHGAHDIVSGSEEGSRVYRENVAKLCGDCHRADKLPGPRGEGAYDEWQQSVHAGKKDGKRTNATCNDCHDSHQTAEFAGSLAKPNISKTCGKCHKEIAAQYDTGVHGQGLARGNLSNPTCTDCHGSHLVLAAKNPDSPVYGYSGVAMVCAQCHQTERINTRFGLQQTTTSYAGSFHGLALKKGDLRSAGCASCHGAHEILPSSDPRSTISPKNIVATCGHCHPAMGKGAALGKIHPTLTREAGTIGEQIQWWVRWLYLGLIPAVLGFMLLHNVLDWIKKVRKHLARRRAEATYVRLSLSERIQHVVLMVSFSLLVISGFALVFGWKVPGLSGEINETARAYTHRIAALMMIGWAVYHTYWVVATKRGRGYFWGMLPRLKDAYDLVYMLAYNLGVWKEKPKFGRFSYIEKMEYLAMVWGTVVMVLTGLILWFESYFLHFLPLWAIDVANIVHYMEAILATLAIIIWHFYSVLCNPDVTPMATHWITGKLTREEMEHEHPLELAELDREEYLRRQKGAGQTDPDMQ